MFGSLLLHENQTFQVNVLQIQDSELYKIQLCVQDLV